MDFNTLLIRLGIDPSCFVNRLSEPVRTEGGFIYEAEQKILSRECPFCGDTRCIVNDHDIVEINCSETDQITDTLRIRKVRLKCRACGKTFTPPINGIERYFSTSRQTVSLMVGDFTKVMTFSDIARRYGVTTARVLQIFDENVKYVPRKRMPKALCIDEIRFEEDINQKFCCVLYDHDRHEIVDMIRNRQMGYLDEYFSKIPEKERRNVLYFISDMYDGYATVRKRYFSHALHIVDIFHVVTQLTNAVNRIRVRAMKNMERGSLCYRFMKAHWELFLCRKDKIPDRFYTSRKDGNIYHYDELLFRCLLEDGTLMEAYNVLQDLFDYSDRMTFTESVEFVDHLANRLLLSTDELLVSVGYTYRRWRIEIANGFARNQSGKHYTNGIAESINNQLKTITKSAYGYRNFDRFRKRAMMIITYKNGQD